jgi:hypothetical protein
MNLQTQMNIETELIGLPSGQVIYIYSAFIPILYNYGFILYHPDYNWTFKDEDEHRIIKIINKRDICLF